MLSKKWRQKNLRWLGFYLGKIDGSWGPESKNATKKFQKFAGIKVDAIYGKNTDEQLIYTIKLLQKKLNIKADGYAGDKTILVTKKYQKNNKLTVDGICGPTTRAKLKTISSGLRCQKYNDSLSNSINNSYHRLGKAIDFSIKGVSGKKLYNYLKNQPEVKYTYIIKGNWVHFNTY